MEEIKVGEYVRTYNGLIGKIVQITDSGNYAIRIYNGAEYVVRAVIVKHSKNIIDLIEVGDFVNGYKILEIADSIYENSKRILVYKNEKEKYERWIYIQQSQDDIETILTHEQYENNVYRIGG